jgi:hypothetical protein
MDYYKILPEPLEEDLEKYYAVPWVQIPKEIIEKNASKIVKRVKVLWPGPEIKEASVVWVEDITTEEASKYNQGTEVFPSSTHSELNFVMPDDSLK